LLYICCCLSRKRSNIIITEKTNIELKPATIFKEFNIFLIETLQMIESKNITVKIAHKSLYILKQTNKTLKRALPSHFFNFLINKEASLRG
jgi:hypothetical protein